MDSNSFRLQIRVTLTFIANFTTIFSKHISLLTLILFHNNLTFQCKNHKVHSISTSRLMKAYGLGRNIAVQTHCKMACTKHIRTLL